MMIVVTVIPTHSNSKKKKEQSLVIGEDIKLKHLEKTKFISTTEEIRFTNIKLKEVIISNIILMNI